MAAAKLKASAQPVKPDQMTRDSLELGTLGEKIEELDIRNRAYLNIKVSFNLKTWHRHN